MSKRMIALLVSLVPPILLLWLLAKSTQISGADHSILENLSFTGNFLMGVGALLAAAGYVLPFILYLYFSERLEDGDTWWELAHDRKNENLLVYSVVYFNRSNTKWLEPLKQVREDWKSHLTYRRINNPILKAWMFAVLLELNELDKYLKANGKAYTDPPTDEAAKIFKQVLRAFRGAVKVALQNEVQPFIRKMLQEKYHVKAKTLAESN